MSDELIEDLKLKLEKVLEVVGDDMNTVRTGRAKPDMVGNIEVSAYGGQKMKILELASISAPDHSLIVVEPWDKSVLRDIEKAITDSELQVSPVVSGEIVRIPVPPLTEERRMDFVKLLKQKLESGRVMLRQARQDIKEKIDDLEGKPGVSEDDVKNLLVELQDVFEDYAEKLEEMGEKKEEEVLKV